MFICCVFPLSVQSHRLRTTSTSLGLWTFIWSKIVTTFSLLDLTDIVKKNTTILKISIGSISSYLWYQLIPSINLHYSLNLITFCGNKSPENIHSVQLWSHGACQCLSPWTSSTGNESKHAVINLVEPNIFTRVSRSNSDSVRQFG